LLLLPLLLRILLGLLLLGLLRVGLTVVSLERLLVGERRSAHLASGFLGHLRLLVTAAVDPSSLRSAEGAECDPGRPGRRLEAV